MSKILKDSDGFTMMEFVVALAIMGVLMSIAIPSYNRYDSINDKSFKVLYDAGYKPDMIDLFVADKTMFSHILDLNVFMKLRRKRLSRYF